MISSTRIYQWINTVLLTAILLSLFGNHLGIPNLTALHVLAAGIAILLPAVMQCFGKKGYLAGSVLLCTMILLLILVAGPSRFLSFTDSYLRRITGQGGFDSDWTVLYEILQTVVLAAFSFFVQMLLERYLKVKVLAGLLLFAYLAFGICKNLSMPSVGLTFSFCYLALICVEWIQNRWQKKRRQSPKNQMAWLLPFMAVYCILLLMMPVSQKPYDWQWAKQAFSRIKDSFFTFTESLPFGNKEDFDTGYAGFSPDSAMPGTLAHNRQEIMTLTAENKLFTNIYLTGQIADTFDGQRWSQNREIPAYGRLLDTFQTFGACKAYNNQYAYDYLQNTPLTVRYLKYHTSYLFAPLKTQAVISQGRRVDLSSMQDQWRFGSLKSYGTEYHLVFYQMNTGQDEFYRFLENAREPSDEEWEQILKNYGQQSGQSLSLHDVADYEAAVYDAYGQTFSLPDAVSSWLLNATEGCETDVEKLRAIERELSGYTYHTSPGPLPSFVVDEASFLEYFLTQSKQGYCAHFATAFVLLARAEGIPARYVQGYFVPIQGKKEITVTSDMAHAWAEVYVEGAGWIPFDPTPGYQNLAHASWRLRQETESDRHDNLPVSDNAPISPTQESEVSPMPQTAAPSPESGKTRLSSQVMRILGFAMLLTVLLLLIAWRLERKMSLWKYRRMDCSGRFLMQIHRCTKLLAALGCRRKDNETIEEFSQNAAALLQDKAPLNALTLYETFLYGKKPVSEEDLKLVIAENETLLQFLKQKNRWKYFRYLLF